VVLWVGFHVSGWVGAGTGASAGWVGLGWVGLGAYIDFWVGFKRGNKINSFGLGVGVGWV
jgi:hypothetical protein